MVCGLSLELTAVELPDQTIGALFNTSLRDE
jgi:hypothetical protein